jgi:hypothetical protein
MEADGNRKAGNAASAHAKPTTERLIEKIKYFGLGFFRKEKIKCVIDRIRAIVGNIMIIEDIAKLMIKIHEKVLILPVAIQSNNAHATALIFSGLGQRGSILHTIVQNIELIKIDMKCTLSYFIANNGFQVGKEVQRARTVI